MEPPTPDRHHLPSIRELDIEDDESLSEWFGPVEEAQRADWPGEPGWTQREIAPLIRDRSATSVVAVALDDDGTSAASLWVRMPVRDNRHIADLQLNVRPARRRRGLGRALLGYATEIARTNGRSKLVATTDEPLDAGEDSGNRRFAAAAGFEPGLAEVRRQLHLTVAQGRLERLREESLPAAVGYEIESWNGTCPDRFLEDRVELARAISRDAPQGRLDKEVQDWDVPRLVELERSLEKMDRISCTSGVIGPSGRMVGFTQIGVPRTTPEVAYQWDTVVLPEHRGHRLGMLLKVANLVLLGTSSPRTRRILTWNADANTYMNRVNEAIGYEPVGVATVWQKQMA